MPNFSGLFRYFDLYIFGSSVLLLFLGLLMIYSTTLESDSNLLLRQIIFVIGGFVGMIVLAFYDYRNFKKITPWLYLFMVLALVTVWLAGPTIRGSARWIDLGFFRFQPAEFAKLIMVIVTAKYLDQAREKIKAFRYVFLALIYISIPAALILIEPDLGSAMILLFTWFAMLMFSRINKKHLVALLAVFILLSFFSWSYVLQDYQKQRLYTFLDPHQDPQGQGYNVLQSIIAVGSGEIFGRGLGRGLQSQLKFLPERQTDFIFASTAEELGFLGSIFILGLYLLLFIRFLKIIIHSRDNFGMYLGTGILFMLLIQVVINIGMNIGILPVTGIPLPLLSYGGSSLITTFLALGIIQSIVARQKAVRFAG